MSQYYPLQEMLYRSHQRTQPQPVKFLYRQGQNTSLVAHDNDRSTLAHDTQLAALPLNETSSNRPHRERQTVKRYPDVDPRVGRILHEQKVE